MCVCVCVCVCLRVGAMQCVAASVALQYLALPPRLRHCPHAYGVAGSLADEALRRTLLESRFVTPTFQGMDFE